MDGENNFEGRVEYYQDGHWSVVAGMAGIRQMLKWFAGNWDTT